MLAAGLLVAVIGVLPGPRPLPSPGGSASLAPVPHPAVAAVTIAPWEEFWQDDSNPFVPWQLRGASAAPGAPGARPPAGPATFPDRSLPPAPDRALPRRAPGGGGVPEILGFQRGGSDPGTLWVRLPGGTSDLALRCGDRVAGWTLLGIETGTLARLSGPDGRIHLLVIGR